MYALFAPAKTPAPIVKRLHTEVAQYLKSAAGTERLFNAGVEAVGSTPRELAIAMESEMSRMGKLIKDARLRGP
jgi:tripartite-type tricarboxylate transporter receptor subunit TctC